MAKKKKEEEFKYLQTPLPDSQKTSRAVTVDWSGLNYRQTLDTGALSYEKNISTNEAPYLTPSGTWEEVLDFGEVYDEVTNDDGTGTEWIGENIVKAIYGYRNMLFAMLYKKGATTGKIVPYVEVYNQNMEKLGFESSEGGKIGVLTDRFQCEELKAVAFSMDKSASGNIAKPSDIQNTVLFFPGNYSFKIPVVQDVVYSTRYILIGNTTSYISPWGFTKSFTDKSKIYNVVKSASTKIPKKSAGPVGAAQYDWRLSISLTDDDEENEKIVLGTWAWRKGSGFEGWCPTKYDFKTGEMTNTEYKINDIEKFSTDENPCPVFKDAAVFQSRLFGIDDGKVYASMFNNYCGWILDNADEETGYSAEHAWISSLSANPEADGELTAIITYQDRVIIFRENYMYEIRNTKNPFRVVDIFQEGCIGREAVKVVADKLIFVSRNGVKLYTGSKPQDIGYKLNIDDIVYSAAGTDGRRFFMYCETPVHGNNLFIYDNFYGQWSQMETKGRVLCFTHNNTGMFMLTDDNKIYKLNDMEYNHSWALETDFNVEGTINIKHIQKIQILAEIASGSALRAYILYDGEEFNAENSHKIIDYENIRENTVKLPIRVVPRKTACYGYKIRIEGEGYSKIYQMEVILRAGGELYGYEG